MIYKDQMMRDVRLSKPPSRIISLVPSLTELLCDMGLEKELVGITKFCIHPDHVYRSVTRIGGTKNIDHEKIKSLQPDLIIANKEENLESDIKEIEKYFPVWISDISNLDEALAMIQNLGEITGKNDSAFKWTDTIINNFSSVIKLNNVNTLYLIWNKPYMAAGKNTFIDDMLIRCGLNNVISAERYPEITEQKIAELNPQIVFLSSEPFPFSDKHINELKNIIPDSQILLVNGEYYSWYGSRLAKSPSYFNSISAMLN